VRNKDAEARRKAAIGLGQLAELYSRAASQRLQTALAEIGKQMQEEREQELQTLLSAAFVRLSQEAASRRYYRAMIQALDSLNLLEAVRPSWVQGLRPRLGIEIASRNSLMTQSTPIKFPKASPMSSAACRKRRRNNWPFASRAPLVAMNASASSFSRKPSAKVARNRFAPPCDRNLYRKPPVSSAFSAASIPSRWVNFCPRV
jgi:hypothetical protein